MTGLSSYNNRLFVVHKLRSIYPLSCLCGNDYGLPSAAVSANKDITDAHASDYN